MKILARICRLYKFESGKKMKTLFFSLILGSLFLGLVLPFDALAQTKPVECCKIRHNIRIDNDVCGKVTIGKVGHEYRIAGPETGASGAVYCPTEVGTMDCPRQYVFDATGNPTSILPTTDAGLAAPNNVRGVNWEPAGSAKWGIFCALDTIYTVIDWVFLFLVLIVIVLTIWGGFQIMMAKDTATGITAGREKILAAAIGLVVALMAKMVPSIVKAILGYA